MGSIMEKRGSYNRKEEVKKSRWAKVPIRRF
jgi:hypothetical protein